jgi:alpha-D-glucose phosphate-specific phosphoglucomutase
MVVRIKFGTDGWRGIIADDFTFDNVRICAQAVAQYLQENKPGKQSIVVGYDTRFASDEFASAAAEVLAANDITVFLCVKPTPTPVVSFAVPSTNSAGAIVITASHNPGRWNGFKFKGEDGASAPKEVTSQIERNIALLFRRKVKRKRLPLDRALRKGLVSCFDPRPSYFAHLSRLVDLGALRRHRLNIIVDSMYGAGAGYFKTILQDGNITVTEINAEKNPSFPEINPEPIARNLTRLSKLVVDHGADLGLATDGDADRVGIIDEKGRFLSQHQVFALLCLYLLEVRGQRGAMIKTLTSSTMISRLGEIFHVPVYETPVGFKYVAPLMIRENAIIGGEESGGYGFRGHIPERDGILAGLYFLDFMVKTGKSASQLLDYLYSKVGPHHYDRMDFHISAAQRRQVLQRLASGSPESIGGFKVTRVDTTDGFRFFFSEDSWLLIRFSGTEPLVRIYAEAENEEKVQSLLNEGRKLAGL